MRIFAIGVILLLSPCLAFALGPNNRPTGSEFTRDCRAAIQWENGGLLASDDYTKAQNCLSYLHGMRDAMSIPFSGRAAICPSDQVTTFQLARVFVKFAEANPERLHEDAFNLAMLALINAFPCQASAI